MSGFRLSPQQRRLCQLDGGTFRTQAAFHLAGELDRDRLARSVESLAERHEILRTTFPPVPGLELPLQAPGEAAAAVDFAYVDRSEHSADDRAKLLAKLRNSEIEAPLDISGAGLLRLRLARIGADEHLLVWTQPSLYGDRTSIAGLMTELADLYAANGHSSPGGQSPEGQLPEGQSPSDDEPMQYADLAEWLNEILEEDADEGLGYWRQQDGVGVPGPFPLAHSPASGTYEPRSSRVPLSADTLATLASTAQAVGVAPEVLLQALWAVMLSRFNGTESLRLDTLFDGRSYEGLEDAVGLFARFLPIVAEVDSSAGLRDLATQLGARCGEAGEWQEYFSADRLEHAAASTTYGFSYFRSAGATERGAVTWTTLAYHGSTEPHLLELSCLETPGDLVVDLTYDADRLDSTIAQKLAANFAALCEDGLRRPEEPIARLRLIDDEEARQLTVVDEPEAPAPTASRIIDLIFERVEAAPDAAAVTCGEETLSYAELWARAGHVACGLQDSGAAAGDIVAVCCQRSVDLVVGVLGAMRAGAAYLPLDPAYPAERLDFMSRDAGARFVVHHPPTTERVAALPCEAIDLTAVAAAEPAPLAAATDADLAYVIYTSGSTGVPKGVAVTQANLVHSTTARFHFYREGPGRFLLLSSYAFDSSVVGLFWTLSSGGTLILPEEGNEQDVGLLIDLVAQHEVTHTLCLPTLYSVLLDQSEAGQLSSLRVVAVAGEACPPALVRRHFEHLDATRLFNEYGPTEATVWAIAAELEPTMGESSVPIGRAVPYARAYLLDDGMHAVPDGLAGEICLGGAGITSGYLGRPEVTEERFLPDPFSDRVGARLYRTGDRGRRRADGQIEFLGRLDHQVKIRGYRIEPGEIEARLEEHDGVRQVVVAPHRTEAGELRLVAYIVASGDQAPNVSDLRAALLMHLPEYMVPAVFTTLDEMPLTPTGKVDRNALPEPDQDRPDLAAEYEAPDGLIETYLVGRWEEILQTDRVGVHDNFFELGGNSIQAAIFMNRVRGEIDDFVHVGRLFEHPTVRQLATYLVQEHAEAIQRLGTGIKVTAPSVERQGDDKVVERVADMSDDEVDSMLEELLAEEESGA